MKWPLRKKMKAPHRIGTAFMAVFIVAILAGTLHCVTPKHSKPQIYHGTVIYFDFANDDLTIAADSRTGSSNRTIDTECKLSAFGAQFVFAVSGLAWRTTVLPSGEEITKWRAQSLARDAWEAATSTSSKKTSVLVNEVAFGWTSRMEVNFQRPADIRLAHSYLSQNNAIIAEGLFAATDTSGIMVMKAVTILVDLPLFDTTGQVQLTHEIVEGKPDSWGSTGYDEIVEEFKLRKSPRAKEHMEAFDRSVATLSKPEQRARLASELIDLSIANYPRRELLGPPVRLAANAQLQSSNNS